MDATQIAGLNCLRLMNETTAGKKELQNYYFFELLNLEGCEILKLWRVVCALFACRIGILAYYLFLMKN